jgi:hypothetical protein
MRERLFLSGVSLPLWKRPMVLIEYEAIAISILQSLRKQAA